VALNAMPKINKATGDDYVNGVSFDERTIMTVGIVQECREFYISAKRKLRKGKKERNRIKIKIHERAKKVLASKRMRKNCPPPPL
jgi:hypothetical protein